MKAYAAFSVTATNSKGVSDFAYCISKHNNMLRNLSLTLFACTLLLVSCEKESINIIEETPETINPVVVETTDDEDVFFLRMPDGENVELEGEAVIDENGLIGLVTSGSSAVRCVEGGISISIDATDPGFFLAITTVPEQTVFLAGGVDIDGFAEGYSFTSLECSEEAPSLEITTLTEDRVAGVYTTEFFTGVQVTGCEDLTSIGVIDVVFDVPLTACE